MSTLGNLPRQQTMVRVAARKSFAFGMKFIRAADDTFVNITGATIRLVIAEPRRFGGNVVITKNATILDALLGTAQFPLQAVDLDLRAGAYPFVVTMLTSTGYSTPILEGTFEIEDNPDPATTGTFSDINPSTQLAVYLDGNNVVNVKIAALDGLGNFEDPITSYLELTDKPFIPDSLDDLADGGGFVRMTSAERTKLTGIATGATVNSSDATLLARVNHTGVQSADTLTDGTSNKAYTTAEKTKLGGIATGATANQSDATLKDRANHTGSQPSSTISDFTEAAQDAVAALLAAGTNITLSYNDAGNSLSITAAGGGGGGLDAEAVRDAIGVALIGSGVITVTVNDALDTITISSTATANDTDANLRARASHTGTQSADSIVDGTSNKAYTAAEKTKLAGIATGATQNSGDATLLARANHTGTQLAATVSNFDEAARDAIGLALEEEDSTIVITVDDSGDKIYFRVGSVNISHVTNLQTELDAIESEIQDLGTAMLLAVTYADLPPGTTITAYWNGSVYKIGSTTISSRPSSRTDLTFVASGGTTAPGWLITGDLFDKDV